MFSQLQTFLIRKGLIKGTLTDHLGNEYNGDWKNNSMHGKGTYTWYTGIGTEKSHLNIYSGDFKYGKMTGQGTLKYFWSGDVYTGEFKDGKHHGKGTLIYGDWAKRPSGASYVGDWMNDMKHGKGVETTDDGKTLQGEFVNGKCHGKFIITFSNGEKCSCDARGNGWANTQQIY